VSGDALVAVVAKPGSRSPGITVADDALHVRVAERAHEGKANEACRAALARALGVAPSRVELMRGARSKKKFFRVTGCSAAEIKTRLARLQKT
jgi:uncharacterized protein